MTMTAQADTVPEALEHPVIEAVDAVQDKVENVQGDKAEPNEVEVKEAPIVNTGKELTKDKYESAVKDIEDRAYTHVHGDERFTGRSTGLKLDGLRNAREMVHHTASEKPEQHAHLSFEKDMAIYWTSPHQKEVLYLPANKFDAAAWMSKVPLPIRQQFLRKHPEYTESGSVGEPPVMDHGKARFLDTYNKVRSVSQSTFSPTAQAQQMGALNALLDTPAGNSTYPARTINVGSSFNCAGITSDGSGRDISKDPELAAVYDDAVLLEPHMGKQIGYKPLKANPTPGYIARNEVLTPQAAVALQQQQGRASVHTGNQDISMLAKALIQEHGFVTNLTAPTKIIDDRDGKRFDATPGSKPLATESRQVHEDLGDSEQVHDTVTDAVKDNEAKVDMDLQGEEGVGQPEHEPNEGRESNEGTTLAEADVQAKSAEAIAATEPAAPESTAEVDGAQQTATAADPNNNERGVNDWLREGTAKLTQFALSESGRAVIGMAVPMVGRFLAKRVFSREVPENPRKRRRVVPVGRARNTVDLGEMIEDGDSE